MYLRTFSRLAPWLVGIIIAAAIVAAMLLARPAHADPLVGAVTVVVVDKNGAPMPNAEVHLFDLAAQAFIPQTAVTDASGAASIGAVPVGRYHVGAYVDGPCNLGLSSPGLLGWQVDENVTTGPITIVMQDAPASTAAWSVFGYLRYVDSAGAHPIGPGAHVDFFSGGRLVGSADSNANGQYTFGKLACPVGAWGYYTYIATWTDKTGAPRKACGINFGVWRAVSIRTDITFDVR